MRKAGCVFKITELSSFQSSFLRKFVSGGFNTFDPARVIENEIVTERKISAWASSARMDPERCMWRYTERGSARWRHLHVKICSFWCRILGSDSFGLHNSEPCGSEHPLWASALGTALGTVFLDIKKTSKNDSKTLRSSHPQLPLKLLIFSLAHSTQWHTRLKFSTGMAWNLEYAWKIRDVFF